MIFEALQIRENSDVCIYIWKLISIRKGRNKTFNGNFGEKIIN